MPVMGGGQTGSVDVKTVGSPRGPTRCLFALALMGWAAGTMAQDRPIALSYDAATHRLQAVSPALSAADHAETACPTQHERLMRVAVVALRGAIARRVAVHASRMLDHLAGFGEDGDRALFLIGNAGKFAGRFERAARIGLRG